MFDDIETIKEFMKMLSKVPAGNQKISKDCEWFSSINYTTLSEYAGELGLFVDELLVLQGFAKYHSQLLELKRVLAKLF